MVMEWAGTITYLFIQRTINQSLIKSWNFLNYSFVDTGKTIRIYSVFLTYSVINVYSSLVENMSSLSSTVKTKSTVSTKITVRSLYFASSRAMRRLCKTYFTIDFGQ